MGEDLLWAVKNGDMDQLKVLIEEKVNICLDYWLVQKKIEWPKYCTRAAGRSSPASLTNFLF